jgi:hypothetical protein
VNIANGRERRNAGRNDSSSVCHDAGRVSPASIGGTLVDTSAERVFTTADALPRSQPSHADTSSHAYHIRHSRASNCESQVTTSTVPADDHSQSRNPQGFFF